MPSSVQQCRLKFYNESKFLPGKWMLSGELAVTPHLGDHTTCTLALLTHFKFLCAVREGLSKTSTLLEKGCTWRKEPDKLVDPDSLLIIQRPDRHRPRVFCATQTVLSSAVHRAGRETHHLSSTSTSA